VYFIESKNKIEGMAWWDKYLYINDYWT